jgi:hypothetical protein
MALAIPIITEFDGKGIKSALNEFKNLETGTQKVGFAAQQAAKLAVIGFAALGASAAAAGAVLFKAAQAAAADQAAQVQLANSIKATTTASDLQIKGVEEFIDKTQRATGVADDNLRPALGRLVRATGDVTKAQDLLNLSLDLSASTGKSVETVANAVAKAQEGSYGPLAKLGVGYDAATLKAAGFEKVQGMLEERFGGSAAEKAKTYEGVMARLKITLGELQESIGYKVLPILTELGDSAIRISEAFGLKGAAGGVNQLGKEITSLGTDADGMINTFGKIYNSIAGLVNGIMNALALPLSVINFLRTGELGNYKVKGLPTFDQLLAANPSSNRPVSTQQAEAMFAASGGAGVSGAAGGAPATIPPLPPKTSKAPPSIFDNTSGNAGGFEYAGIGGIGPFDNLVINLDTSGSLISSPATIGQDIIDAILAAQRDSGVVFAPAATL